MLISTIFLSPPPLPTHTHIHTFRVYFENIEFPVIHLKNNIKAFHHEVNISKYYFLKNWKKVRYHGTNT